VTAAVDARGDSDADLVAAWRGGDQAAAAALVARHTRPLARFLAAAGAQEDLEDVVQETFFRAFDRIESFQGKSSFRTWLFAIGSNALKDLGRRRKRATVLSIEDRDVPDARHGPHEQVVGRELLERLGEAVSRLPTMQRNVFLMRAQHGAEYADIAAALGTSVGAARVHYHHAVKRLKVALE
jgi:RNA polymerase sigma-70 factor (ECF subfamily)